MYQAPPTYHKNRSLIKQLWLKIILVALINGSIANIALWVKHHEGIFWSLSYQRIGLIYAIIIVFGNSLFFVNLIILSLLRPTSQRYRLYSASYLILILVGNDRLFWFIFGADFAQLYLSRVPITLFTLHLLWRWRQFIKH
ncbi:hypothetical protein [Herpetosiphon giganteus]|uniref:hypothetical protein n=1 Tax=Herpetosiphon giganteus TaxID=2029754 RepID=UPI0019578A83|nr:hypothetical protein [Herpetosiphon giganteus]MBM7843121.1 hypothetical protein [Herpetosiphon giganteus]